MTTKFTPTMQRHNEAIGELRNLFKNVSKDQQFEELLYYMDTRTIEQIRDLVKLQKRF